jgi:hypothetical protein
MALTDEPARSRIGTIITKAASRMRAREEARVLQHVGFIDELWEYDEVLLVAGDQEAAIRDLLVDRLTAGWELHRFESAPRAHLFVFKRPR